MSIRVGLLRWLHGAPYIRGRDRLFGMLSASFVLRPAKLPDGLLMYLDVSEWTQLDILMQGELEPLTIELMRRLLAEGDTMIDVGAHVGFHALAAARAVGRSGRVIAIDPQPYNADRVARNAAINGLTQILTLCAAAGEESGFVKIAPQPDRDRARLSLRAGGSGNEAGAMEVPLRRLDQIMAANGLDGASLVKIDTEGYEFEVLKGLGDKLKNCHNIILEVFQDVEPDRIAAICGHLTKAGFVFYSVDGMPWTLGMALAENNLWASQPGA